jgi:hypothetical protein
MRGDSEREPHAVVVTTIVTAQQIHRNLARLNE